MTIDRNGEVTVVPITIKAADGAQFIVSLSPRWSIIWTTRQRS